MTATERALQLARREGFKAGAIAFDRQRTHAMNDPRGDFCDTCREYELVAALKYPVVDDRRLCSGLSTESSSKDLTKTREVL